MEKKIPKTGIRFIRVIGLIQLIFLLIFISGPFVWIWCDWYYGWRLTLTGLIGIVISYYFGQFVEEIIKEVIREHKKESKPKSKFKDRIEELKKENEIRK